MSFFVVMNEAKWGALSAEDQAAILSVSGEKLAKAAGKIWDKADADGYRIMAEKGKMTLVRPDGAPEDFPSHSGKNQISSKWETAFMYRLARDHERRQSRLHV